MYEMKSAIKSGLKSLSLFVGTGECNGHCAHCAGIIHRKYAPKDDGIINETLISKTLRECYEMGARSLSISSSGEPTLSPKSITKTLDVVKKYANQGIKYFPINLYSNGIIIGEDESFCKEHLPLWKNNGLTTIYVTVHDVDEKKNAKIYGVESYPKLEDVISHIHDSKLLMRANIVLSRKNIGTKEKFSYIIKELLDMGADYVSAWPIRNKNDEIDSFLAPTNTELNKMREWLMSDSQYANIVRLLGETNKLVYNTNQKLTLFPDGTLSSTWCNS